MISSSFSESKEPLTGQHVLEILRVHVVALLGVGEAVHQIQEVVFQWSVSIVDIN